MTDTASKIRQYILDTYGVAGENPWMNAPDQTIFRHPRTGKWFAVLLEGFPCSRLTPGNAEKITLLNVKCDPLLIPSLTDEKRIFPAYHMNKEHWISLLSERFSAREEIAFFINMSYHLVNRKRAAYAPASPHTPSCQAEND